MAHKFHDAELARRLCAAFVSHRAGLKSMDYTLKHYLTGEPGKGWLDLADRLLSNNGVDDQTESS